MAPQNGIKIEKLRPYEVNDVYNLLTVSFFKDEPLSSGYTIPKQEDIFALNGIEQGYSLKVTDEEGNIIAVGINLDLSRLSKDSVTPTSERLKRIFTLMDYIAQQVEIIPGVLDLHILAVNPKWRNKGLASLICEHSERLAYEHGFKGMNMLCTGMYSSKMAESRGYKCRYSLHYDNYTDEVGKPIFNVKLPHIKLGVYTKLFENND